jgi:NhaP-type Na+/H+ or K+/H+ antiporter
MARRNSLPEGGSFRLVPFPKDLTPTMHELLIPFAGVAAVLLVSGLVSGVARQAPVSVPMIFLGLGLAVGDGGLGLVHVAVHDRALEVTAVLSLALVLFLDSINLRIDRDDGSWRALLLSLGPGTILTVGIAAVAAHLVLGLPLLQSLLLGAILASIDPVVLRDVVRDERVPASIRQALATEASTNDIIVLPLILILAAIARGQAHAPADWIVMLVRMFLLAPLAGVAAGLGSVWVMRRVRARSEIDRSYRAIFGVGAVLAAYVAGEAAGGSGFLAILAGGAAVVATDYDLCDCLVEYGEITADMLMLGSFILFGALLSPLVRAMALGPALLFAGVVLAVARPVAIGLVLRRAVTSTRARLFIGWFGPRGLSSLLLALLVVSQRVPAAEHLLAISGVVVIASVVAHGVTATPLAAAYQRVSGRQWQPRQSGAPREVSGGRPVGVCRA